MSWITTISEGIDKAFSAIRPPVQMVPTLLLLCELANRPGLSAIALTAAIIKRLPQAGIPTGLNKDGTPNKVNQFVRIMSEEIVNEFKNNCVVQVGLAPGSTVVQGTGANAAGAVLVQSTNILPITGKGGLY